MKFIRFIEEFFKDFAWFDKNTETGCKEGGVKKSSPGLLVAELGDPSTGGLTAGLAAGLGDGGPRLRRFDTRAQRADDGTALDAALARADAVVLRGVTLLDVPGLAFTRLPLLVDLRGTDLLALMRNAARTDGPGAALADLCERADAVVVDDDRSRDILLGALAGAHRVNDAVYDSDPSLSELRSEEHV